ncbi:MAG: type IV pilus assembly protein PilF [Alteromonadaceae bacterium]|jgi:type IV pilus assembly protein PilF
MDKIIRVLLSIILVSLLSACVTKNYENNDDKPVIENSSTNNEIAMTRISLGLGYLKIGNTTQAKLNLEKAKRFAPKLTQVYTAYAHYYDTVEEPELAIISYEKALSLDNKDADTLNNYGVFLCRQQRYVEAEKQILKAIDIPSYLLVSQSYENLALCQLKAKNFDKAQLYFEKSIAHNPNNASTLLQMVRLQYAFGEYQKAQDYLRKYEKSTRRFNANALSLAYKVYAKQHNLRIAKNYASMLVKMFPNSYEAKQYILNELQHIEADDLAEQYRLSTVKFITPKSKKRVIVLSPKKILDTSSTQENIASNTPLENESNEVKGINPTKAVEVIEVNDVSTKDMTLITHDDSKVNIPFHEVQSGESLFAITKKYNIYMHNLESWNNFKRSQILRIGDIIYLANPNPLEINEMRKAK